MEYQNIHKDLKKASFIIMVFFFLQFFATLQGSFSAANASQMKPNQANFGSSTVFRLAGNVHPDGIYIASIRIGSRARPYVLDIDTGSDLTWVECDGPCKGCTKPPELRYKPKNNFILCNDPICAAYHSPKRQTCKSKDEKCLFHVEYTDGSSSKGILVKDAVPLCLTNGTRFAPILFFGCANEIKFSDLNPRSTDGVLGLGITKSSIVWRLRALGITQNVLGHCLNGRGGGYLFFGNDLASSSRTIWVPMIQGEHYQSGPAELLFDGQRTNAKGLDIIFDSGTSFTYFNPKAYQAIESLVLKNLVGKPLKVAPEDKTLVLCWKGERRFCSVGDVNKYFKPIVLSFTSARNAQFQIPPEAYLIITKLGNVCLGILKGKEVGFGNYNVIGDISMLDKLTIYDNERHRIGWAPANCDRLPNS